MCLQLLYNIYIYVILYYMTCFYFQSITYFLCIIVILSLLILLLSAFVAGYMIHIKQQELLDMLVAPGLDPWQKAPLGRGRLSDAEETHGMIGE